MSTTPMHKLRGAVVTRAGGHCEGCGRRIQAHEADHLDHFFGRHKVAEAVSNCWLLCLTCDSAKTTHRPGAAYWLTRFIDHCARHGLVAELEMAETKLAVLKQKGLAR